ncbi:MAG: hypothetical protein WC516_06620 [Patescibacteria group bacterium]|jgi:hypothetical protein
MQINNVHAVNFFMKKGELDPGAKLIETLLNEINKPEHYPGYPRYNTLKSIRKMGLSPTPGMEPDTTWCIYVAFYVIEKMGFDARPFTDQAQPEEIAIFYTDGNEMPQCAIDATKKGIVKEVTEKEAYDLANIGIPVLCASRGKMGANNIRGTGHVAIVAPDYNSYMPSRIMIGQAGGSNGFFSVNEQFPLNLVEAPRYFVPNKHKA